jgi:uncharacterized protein YcgI (DUF1989 family)
LEEREKVFEKVMPPKSGLAVEVLDTQILRLTDLEGKQVVDTAIFNLHNPREKLSTSLSRTRKIPDKNGVYSPSDKILPGDYLKSTLCRPLMQIIEETAPIKGVHECHARFCHRWFYETIFQNTRDGCGEIIAKAVEPYGILPEDLPDTLDINMHYVHHPGSSLEDEGRWEIKEPINRPGDYIELQAKMDVLVAMSNCPEEFTPCNGFKCTPMLVEVFQPVFEYERSA